MKKHIAKYIFTKLLGWRLTGVFPDLDKCVIIVVPHTSWHDFYIGVLIRGILGIRINFVGKKELFKPPFGWYFKWMGGTPLDRTPGQNKVQAIAALFEKESEFRLALAPEGTRKRVKEWKTGFYYIAKEAKVPIVMVAFDFGKNEVKVSTPFYPGKNKEQDFAYMQSFYKNVVGKVPENT